MRIGTNKVVTVTYKLHANLPEEKQKQIEIADEKSPLKFLYGIGMMIPGFEKGLEGKSTGDDFKFNVDAIEGYGQADSTAIVNLPIDIFKIDNVIDFQLLKTGNSLPMSDGEGNVMNGKVLSYDEQFVRMDFNHPLAGHELHFEGKIVEIRDATAEEISHGHVH